MLNPHTKVLRTWNSLNAALRNIDEKGCQSLLDFEKKTKRRSQILIRLFGKYNRLRADRERRELLTLTAPLVMAADRRRKKAV